MVLGPSAVMLTVALLFNPFERIGRCLRVRMLTYLDNILIAASSQCVIAFTFNNPLVKVLGT